jgi:hypothetical protein
MQADVVRCCRRWCERVRPASPARPTVSGSVVKQLSRQVSTFSRRDFSPESWHQRCRLNERAQGKPSARCARWPCCATVAASIIDALDASIGAPGPHDFAVRIPSPPRGFAAEVLVKTEAAPFVCCAPLSLTDHTLWDADPHYNRNRARHCCVYGIPSRVRDDRETPFGRDGTNRS